MLDEVSEFCNQWKIKLNAAKTQCVVFTKSGRWNRLYGIGANKQPISLTINGQTVNPCREAKFLGVTFDSSLSFNTHVNVTVTKCRRRLNILKALRGCDWGADPSLILCVYKQFIRPVMLYGCVAFCRLSKTQMIKLQRVENNALRIAMRLPIYTPTEWLHQNARMPYLVNMWAGEGLRFIEKALSNPEPNFNMLQMFIIEAIFNDLEPRNYQTPLGFFFETGRWAVQNA